MSFYETIVQEGPGFATVENVELMFDHVLGPLRDVDICHTVALYAVRRGVSRWDLVKEHHQYLLLVAYDFEYWRQRV